MRRMIDGQLPQRAIIYDKPGQKACVYTTVYSDKQAERAKEACITKHGRQANVREVMAERSAR
jgi:hypothetical protein